MVAEILHCLAKPGSPQGGFRIAAAIADSTVANYKHLIREIWEKYGHEVETVTITHAPRTAKAG